MVDTQTMVVYVSPMEKICNTCGVSKPLDEFPKQSAAKDGRRGHCRICFNEQERQRHNKRYEQDEEYRGRCIEKSQRIYWRDPGKKRDYANRRHAEQVAPVLKMARDMARGEVNSKRVCLQCGGAMTGRPLIAKFCSDECLATSYRHGGINADVRRKHNREAINRHRGRMASDPEYAERMRAKWREQNMQRDDKQRLFQQWKENNKTRLREYRRQRRTNPEYRFVDIIRRRFRHVLDKGGKSTMDILGFAFEDYERHFESVSPDMWERWKTGNNDLVIDHIIPVKLYDFRNEMEIRKCWNPRNLRIITGSDNARKGAAVDSGLIRQAEIADLLPMGFDKSL